MNETYISLDEDSDGVINRSISQQTQTYHHHPTSVDNDRYLAEIDSMKNEINRRKSTTQEKYVSDYNGHDIWTPIIPTIPTYTFRILSTY